MGCEARLLLGRVCGEMLSLCLCGAPPQGLCKAPHDSGVCWKQFMMLLEEALVCGGVSFHPPCTSRVDEGIRIRVAGRRSARAASVLPYLLSYWWR